MIKYIADHKTIRMTKTIQLCCLGLLIFITACQTEKKKEYKTQSNLLESSFQRILKFPVDSTAIPRSVDLETGDYKNVASKDWTSGFYAGSLWQLYRITKDSAYLKKAVEWTAFQEKEKYNGRTHDMGFKIMCSFGNGLDIIPNSAYRDVIIKSAQTLSGRYDSIIQSIRSWDHNSDRWQYPVIIDNMMNLELLFKTTELTGDSSYYQMAVKHANTTLKNHFRPDGSAYHVVDYDSISGKVRERVTHQGYADESVWARGQAWAIYGYTMCYRFTKDIAYLNQAEKTANFMISHPMLPEDGIPYWDLNDPSIPNAPRDVSAATIMVSAMYELYQYTLEKSYLNYADKVMEHLLTEKYLLPQDSSYPFILKHSTGNWPKNDEIDVPINYADYYFLEALIRQKK